MATLIPDLRKFIVGQEIVNGSSVSEATWRKIGGMINFLGHRTHQEKVFYLNGAYGALENTNYPQLGVDGLTFFEYDAEIFNVWVFNLVAGTANITELDLKIKPKLSGSFTSIFSTTPKISNLAPNDTFFEIGDTGTGITAPVLNGGVPYLVNAGDAMRLDLISVMSNPENAGIVVHFRPR